MKTLQQPSVGLYIRLSRDDLRLGESLSVENQRIFLTNYCKEQGWTDVTEYVDDGYTGVNFDRPSFKRMMEDVKKKKINLIVCKDMSRFGRNYVQVGEFTDYILPSVGCGLIALNDGVDTRKNIDNDMTPFRNLFNEFYCKDISKKVKTGRNVRCQSGKYLGTYAPLGYRLDPDNRYQYLIEPIGAEIVRRIFRMRCEGNSILSIAKQLNAEGVITARDHWYALQDKPNPRNTTHGWTDVSVRQILENEAYIGNMVQNKTGHISYKNKKVIDKPEEDWIRVENTHEPIIDMETWEKVQAMFEDKKVYRTNAMGKTHLFSGLLKCGDCGFNLKGGYDDRRTGENKVAYYCRTYSNGGKSQCTMHYIREVVLKEIVKNDIKAHAERIILDEESVRHDLLSRHERECDNGLAEIKKEIEERRKRLADIEVMIESLYEDRLLRKISDEMFDKFLDKFETERSEIRAFLDEAVESVEDQEQAEVNIDRWIEMIKRYAEYEDIDRPLLLSLIDCIIVGECYTVDGEKTRDIRIVYNFVGEVDTE